MRIFLSSIIYLTLTACGGSSDSGSSDQSTPQTTNNSPISNSGADQTITSLTEITLDGSSSSDANNDNLSYVWSFDSKPPGSNSSLNAADSASPTFTPDKEGDYIIVLVVNDGTVNGESDTVLITVDLPNNPPSAEAGLSQSVELGSSATFSAANSSDIDGDDLTYSWQVLSSPSGSNVITTSEDVSINITPDLIGAYTLEVTVSDGEDSATDSVVLNAEEFNLTPIANAGTDQSVIVGTPITLNGSASSDGNQDPLTYTWTVSSAPQASEAELSNSNLSQPTFISDVVGTYTFSLTVSDGVLTSEVDTVELIVSRLNTAPLADAGRDQNIFIGDEVTLDGSNSSDAEGDDLTYNWTIISKPESSLAELADSNTSYSTFTPDIEGVYSVQLIVSDTDLKTTLDVTVINVTQKNSIPVANAGSDQSVELNKEVILDASTSVDADGDILEYQWSLVSKPAAVSTLEFESDIIGPSFTPTVAGEYVFSLIVNDREFSSEPDSVVILVKTLPEFFSKSKSSSGVIINGLLQNGSTITLSITNNASREFELLSFEVFNGSDNSFAFTDDTELLSDGQLEAGESVGLTITIGPFGAVLPIRIVYTLRDPVSLDIFEVSEIHRSGF